MNKVAIEAIFDVDIIVWIIEAMQLTELDRYVAKQLKNAQAPIIIVMNKIDRVKHKDKLLPFIQSVQAEVVAKEIIPLSAMTGDNVTSLEKILRALLPENPHFFPPEAISDRQNRFLMSEIIREKCFRFTGAELPYSLTVQIESMEAKNNVMHVNALIWVEREGQKRILIGKKGEKLKTIGTLARQDIEALLGQKVFLRLWIKIKSDWSDSARALSDFGYFE